MGAASWSSPMETKLNVPNATFHQRQDSACQPAASWASLSDELKVREVKRLCLSILPRVDDAPSLSLVHSEHLSEIRYQCALLFHGPENDVAPIDGATNEPSAFLDVRRGQRERFGPKLRRGRQ